MNGIELLMRQNEWGCGVEMTNKAVMSGSLDQENKKRIEALGCVFFQKPLRFSELSDWIDECEEKIDLSQPLGILKAEV